jgi:hypothetical protein
MKRRIILYKSVPSENKVSDRKFHPPVVGVLCRCNPAAMAIGTASAQLGSIGVAAALPSAIQLGLLCETFNTGGVIIVASKIIHFRLQVFAVR